MRTFEFMFAVATAALLTAGQACAATVLVVAGGGGGSGSGEAFKGADGSLTTAGTSGGRNVEPDAGGAGGTAGMGGGAGTARDRNGGGGAGLLSAGTAGAGFGSGGGGQSSPSYAGGNSYSGRRSGGFGGGGGGGGGYSGGGGGSYLDASLTALAGLSGINPGVTSGPAADGFITITLLSGTGATPLEQTFGYTGAIQSYTFAATGLYSIIAAGAQGGGSFIVGGSGARIGGSGYFTANSTLDLVVGGGGVSHGFGVGGGGGGGSFVFQTYVAPGVSAVPEPATWAMMIAGFGAVGIAMRRRRQTVTVRFA